MADDGHGPRDVADLARRLLARAPRSEAEIRSALRKGGAALDEIDAVVERLVESGAIDDARLAEHLLLTRAERLRHGPGRLLADLERRGISRRTASETWERLLARGDLDPLSLARARIRRALGGVRSGVDRRMYARLYNALLRAGFDAEAAQAALRRENVEPPDEVASEGIDDDFP